MLDLTEEHCNTVFNACKELYGNFNNNYIAIPEKTPYQVRQEIIDYIKDASININFYIYILSFGEGCFIKKA